jgi:SAM-dependent methyltransferase
MLIRSHLSYARYTLGCAWRAVHPGAFGAVRDAVAGGVALEIGGPSNAFRRGQLWPVYPLLGALDLANYTTDTLWDREASGVAHGLPRGLIRRSFMAEATHLTRVADGAYDVLLASHVIEHLANPIAGLAEWARVLRPGGVLFLVVPHREGTFDHRRPVTPLAHLIEDYRNGSQETDETHVEEVLRLHDLARDPAAKDRETFTDRIRRNRELRSMHHHVFDTDAVLRLVDAVGLQILYVDVPWDIAVVSVVQGFRAPVLGDSPILQENVRWFQGRIRTHWGRAGGVASGLPGNIRLTS